MNYVCPYHQRFPQTYAQQYPQYTQYPEYPQYTQYPQYPQFQLSSVQQSGQNPGTITPQQLAEETLAAIEPAVAHGLKEAQEISYPHALKEAAAISYLIAKGFTFDQAFQMVESWWKMGYQ